MKQFLVAFLVIFFAAVTNAQTPTVKVAVFAPIYIDTAFNDYTYKLGNKFLSKNILPGLEFYNGVMMAIDSLEKENANVEVFIFDSKSTSEPISQVLEKNIWNDMSLIIASFNNRSDVKLLADFAKLKNIPLVSATYPNDGGVTDNANFILINTGLRTHCEAVYKHIQKYYATSNLVYFKRKGAVEDMLLNYFGDMGKTTPAIPLKYKTVELTDSFTYKQMVSYLDSNKQNIAICGTLNEAFGIRMVKGLVTYKRYPAVAIGMPTWDGIKDLSKPSGTNGKGLEIVYTTPYYFSRTDKMGKYITNKYKDKYFARPSDWVFKGFETMYHFTKLFLKNPTDFMGHLSDKDGKLFNEFDIQPIKIKPFSFITDYYENKKLYFIKKQDGVTKQVY